MDSHSLGSRLRARWAKTASGRLLPYLALVVGVFALGCSAIFVSWANAPGAVTGFYRMSIAAVVMVLPAGLAARRDRPLSRWHIGVAAVAGLCFGIDSVLWNTSILYTSAANAALLGNTAPVWVGIGALLLFKERLRPAFWAGILLALAGAGTVLSGSFRQGITFGVGDMLALLTGVFYGGYYLAIQRARERLRSMLTWWICVAVAAIVTLVLSQLLGQKLTGYSVRTYAAFGALALVVQIGGHLAVSYALGHLPASLVSTTLLGQPVVTALLGVPLLGQKLGTPQLLGGVLVLAGIWLAQQQRTAPAKPMEVEL